MWRICRQKSGKRYAKTTWLNLSVPPKHPPKHSTNTKVFVRQQFTPFVRGVCTRHLNSAVTEPMTCLCAMSTLHVRWNLHDITQPESSCRPALLRHISIVNLKRVQPLHKSGVIVVDNLAVPEVKFPVRAKLIQARLICASSSFASALVPMLFSARSML